MGTYLTKGTTFTTGDTVTAGALNNLVDNATVTAGSIGSAELGSNSVTADKISTSAPQPVTTSTIRDNAIDNTKLNNMGSQTVKVNATPGSADPTDLGMIGGGTNGSSKILMGTNNSLSVLTATQFKMVDASGVDAFGSTASELQLNTTAISDWDTVALATDVDDDADRLLLWDYDPLELKQISPKKLIQSLPALTTTSGVVRLATTERAIAPDTAGTVDADVLTVNQSASMLAKAWVEFTSTGIVLIKINNGAGYAIDDYTITGMTVDALGGSEFSGLLSSGQILLFSGGGSFLLSADAVATDTKIYGTLSVASVANNETVSEYSETITNSFNITSITRTAEGVFDILFATDLPSNKYIAAITGYNAHHNDILSGNITSRTVAVGGGCTVKFGQYNDASTDLMDPTGNATLIFYGLTS